MFSGSALLVAVLSSLSLAQAATNSSTGASPAAIPQCAANCMSIKITEAAAWFGAGDVSSYCKHPEFLLAYNNCLNDNCKGDDVHVGKQAGVTACAGVTPNASGLAGNTTSAGDPNNSTAHLSGPATAPGDNSTALAGKTGTNTTTPIGTSGTAGLNGALTSTGTNTSSNATSRFSGTVASAANASSQAGDAAAISTSSALLFTALSSCTLSLFL